MVGGVILALVISKNDPSAIYNGALAGLIAVCSGSDLFHPLGALIVGGIGSVVFIKMYTFETEVLKIDDVLGVWPLHGVVGSWGGIAAGIFGSQLLGGTGGVSLIAQITGTLAGALFAVACGFAVYKILNKTMGIRITKQEELLGCDQAIHHTNAYPEGLSDELDIQRKFELLYSQFAEMNKEIV